MNDERFEELLQDMRDESVDPERVAAARARVWDRLQESASAACAELRPALPAYARGELGEARRLLIEDHLGRCVECRHELAVVRGERKLTAVQDHSGRGSSWKRWAIAAGIVLAALYVGRDAVDTALAPAGPNATVLTVSGTLYQPTGERLAPGAAISEGEIVRTTAGSHAVLRLRDGSEVEMNERTELGVQSARSGDSIRLERGDIIVEAADQGARNLRVVTRDSIASVKGTVFAVSSGTVGSLVSVVEGSVEVSQSGFQSLLLPGQQAASSPVLMRVGMNEAVSWSSEAATYYELIAELASIEEALAQSGPAARTEARLVGYLPQNVTAYFAAPNLDGTITDAISLVDQQAAQNTTLGTWWSSTEGQEMRTALLSMRDVGTLLGDELVVALAGTQDPMPLFLAEVRPGSHEELGRVLDDLAAAAEEDLPYYLTEDVLLVSPQPADLAVFTAQIGSGASSPFVSEISSYYDNGVSWLAALDVSIFGDILARDGEEDVARLLGVSSMRYLFVEQRSGATGDESAATLSFSGTREGLASWIAAPGSIGSAEYISPDVLAATAGSTRDPREAFDQLASVLGPESEMMAGFDEIENQTGIDVRDDVAAALGTDFVVAVDSINMGQPTWVGVFEVLNPGSLDSVIQRMVDRVNAEASADLGAGETPDFALTFAEENVNGRTWKVLSGTDADEALYWTYDRGFMVVSADRGAAARAINVRDSASSLIRTSRFQQQFPSGSGVHNSGFMWLDLSRFSDVLAALGQENLGLSPTADPVLVVVTGSDSEIRWASTTRLTSLIFDLLLI